MAGKDAECPRCNAHVHYGCSCTAYELSDWQGDEIARLTLALSTARNDALEEAVTECEKQRLAAMNEDCKRESLGAAWCRESIAALQETT